MSKETTKPALGEYAGISAADCCGECTEARCVITHVGICGHPMKGGLQAAFKMKSDVVARYNRANKILAHAKLDLRFS